MKNIGKQNWFQYSDLQKREILHSRLYPLSCADEVIEEILTITENHYKEMV